jgi:hypothetical protein
VRDLFETTFTAKAVRSKDRMSFETVLNICTQKAVEAVLTVSHVTVTLVPWTYHYDLKKVNCLRSASGVCQQPSGLLFVSSLQLGTIYGVNLQHSSKVKTIL